ncbi:MAG: hypothetical protein K2Y32_03155 [Candidatus Obscuribacterales bacterium]|nr:hypothetical protein [Candidatus Obscuribacterales bacterium]
MTYCTVNVPAVNPRRVGVNVGKQDYLESPLKPSKEAPKIEIKMQFSDN